METEMQWPVHVASERQGLLVAPSVFAATRPAHSVSTFHSTEVFPFHRRTAVYNILRVS